MDALAQQILRARDEGQWVDASMQLEKWVANCRKQGGGVLTPELNLGPSAGGGGGGMLSRLTPRGRFARSGSERPGSTVSLEDDEDVLVLRERMPKLRRLVEREGAAGEQIAFVSVVNKHNEHGKVQARLLVVTNQAVYNMSLNASKCKRRIPLGAVGHITSCEQRGEFVLHVPTEYDYHYSTPSKGYSALDDDEAVASSPLIGVVHALQTAYAAHAPAGHNHLPVRTHNNHVPLSSVVKKKQRSEDDSGGMLGFRSRHRDDDDDDDD